MTDEDILIFLGKMQVRTAKDSKYNSFFPTPKFWDLDLNELDEKDFSYTCVFNMIHDSMVVTVMNVSDFRLAMNKMINQYSDLNPTAYPEYTKGDFEFQSCLVGFVCGLLAGFTWSIIPIVELSGKDAESIATAITLTA